MLTISRLINAFFRWEFNSCESLVIGGSVHPIDYANACPDISITSLHYYFPWAISTLLKWSVFCAVTGRRPRLDLDTSNYFAVADSSLSYEDKLVEYRSWPTTTSRRERYQEFCATSLSTVDEHGAGLGHLAGLRRAAGGHGARDLSGRRARPVRRALPRADRPCGCTTTPAEPRPGRLSGTMPAECQRPSWHTSGRWWILVTPWAPSGEHGSSGHPGLDAAVVRGGVGSGRVRRLGPGSGCGVGLGLGFGLGFGLTTSAGVAVVVVVMVGIAMVVLLRASAAR